MPGQNFGGGHYGGLQPRLMGTRCRQGGDKGLPGADIAVKQAHHAAVRGHITRNFVEGPHLCVCRGKGCARQDFVDAGVIADYRLTRAPAPALGDDLQGQLTREQFIEGEALPRRMGRVCFRKRFRIMQALQRMVPIRPASFVQYRAVMPFRQMRQFLHRRPNSLAQDFQAQPLRQGVYRFQPAKFRCFGFGQNEVRVGDLLFATEGLDLAGYNPDFALRKQAFEVINARFEINKVQKAGLVAHPDLVGREAAFWRLDMTFYLTLDGGDLTFRCLGDRRAQAPVHDRHRPKQHEIPHPIAGHFYDQRGQSRADAGQSGDLLEEREENLGPHEVQIATGYAFTPAPGQPIWPSYVRKC